MLMSSVIVEKVNFALNFCLQSGFERATTNCGQSPSVGRKVRLRFCLSSSFRHAQKSESVSVLPRHSVSGKEIKPKVLCAKNNSNGRGRRSCDEFINFSIRPFNSAFASNYSGRATDTAVFHHHSSHLKNNNSQQYLLTNAQFVVNDVHDYSSYLSNPDKVIDWDVVEEIRVVNTESFCCPICLEFPVAAKITKCGHIYCWACILHYLALSEKAWRRCPICFEPVYEKHLKSVEQKIVPRHEVGQKISFLLMERKKKSLIALPVRERRTSKVDNALLNITDSCNTFSRLLTINSSEVITEIIYRERGELESRKSISDDLEEMHYIRVAVENLNEREKMLIAEIMKFSSLKSDIQSVSDVTAKGESDMKKISNGQSFDKSNIVVDGSDSTIDLNKEESYYFYQVEDGQYLFLHFLNVQCLSSEYGSLRRSPKLLVGKIMQIEEFIMTRELRRKYRYLCHLPLGTNFSLVEVELQSGIVSDQTLNMFEEKFIRRMLAREKRLADEERLSRDALAWERKVLFNKKIISKPSVEQSFGEDDFPYELSSGIDEAGGSSVHQIFTTEGSISFAEVLKLSKPVAIPEVAVASSGESNTAVGTSTLSRPSYKDSFASALNEIFDRMHLPDHNVEKDKGKDVDRNESGKKSKKSRKSKSVVLFST
ncbi:RING finger protein 10 [Trichinella pseudospiralis]|uniref:E3 ubiquitin-protein ligase RNF10 n=1 Tax=Trichinella pseudospiralis TaxID=6337 RepID=A0A0V1JX13_TRIPS|nr:RING finger protein 10 [Trichinella pseudospiralis]KRZ39511.1 RING finger protein 10 [Trichinella pseudospiralis]